MLRKIYVGIGTVVVLGVIIGYFLLRGREWVVRISEQEMKAKLEESLPLQKTYLWVIRVTLSNPRITLIEGSDRLHAGLDLALNLKLGGAKEPLGGSVDVSGTVRYDAETKSFYLKNPRVEKLTLAGIADEEANQANEAVSLALTGYFEKNPVYTLTNKDIKQASARLLLKSLVIEDHHLVVTLGI